MAKNINLNIGVELFNEMVDLQAQRLKFYSEPYFKYSDEQNIQHTEELLKKALANEHPFISNKEVVSLINQVVCFWWVPANSLLYKYIHAYYKYKDMDMYRTIRGFVEDDHGFYFISGKGYDFISLELLGGQSDGNARADFFSFINA